MLNIVRLILLYFIFIIFTLLLCVRVARGDHHLQFWRYTTTFCLRLKLSAAFAEHVVSVWLLKRHFHSAPTHVLIFHQQISETTSQTGEEWRPRQCLSNRLWFAPRALRRFPGHCPHDGFYFLSTWEHTGETRDLNICWIQMRRPSRRWQRSATVPQGALSPSGRGRAPSASTWLDSPIKWHHEFCLMDIFFFKGPTHCFITSIQSQSIFLINIPFLVEHPHCWVLYKNN